MPKAARGAEPLHEQILRAAAPRARQRRGREAEGDAEERDGGYVGPRLARRILREARRQQEELEAEHGPGTPARPPPLRRATPGGPGSEEDEEDEEWPTLRQAAEWDGRCGGGDVEVDPEDEKALEVFMSRAPPLRCGAGGRRWGWGADEEPRFLGTDLSRPPRRTLADVIMEKITEKQTEVQSALSELSGRPVPQLDPRVLEVYRGVREVRALPPPGPAHAFVAPPPPVQ